MDIDQEVIDNDIEENISNNGVIRIGNIDRESHMDIDFSNEHEEDDEEIEDDIEMESSNQPSFRFINNQSEANSNEDDDIESSFEEDEENEQDSEGQSNLSDNNNLEGGSNEDNFIQNEEHNEEESEHNSNREPIRPRRRMQIIRIDQNNAMEADNEEETDSIEDESNSNNGVRMILDGQIS